MPNASLSALPLCLIVAGGVLAQTPPAAPVGMTLPQYLTITRGRFLDRDSDGDGRISAAEFAAGMGARGGARAKAAGGAPAPASMAPGTDTAPAAGGGGGMMASRMFERFDTNHDGYLDKAEIDAMLTRRFERMDTNHDGIVTAAERDASRGAMRGRAGAEE